MMSIWKLRVGAENYYLAEVARGLEDYYTGRGEMPGRWAGAAASGLGLGIEPVDGDALRAVLAGLQPGTGASPNGGRPRTWKGRVPGFDLTFAAPKSVSILYGLGDPLVAAEVTAAMERAVDEALAWLERETCFVRRGSNNRAAATGSSAEFGTRRLRGAGFVAAAFGHRTSRAGDPHLHTHVLVANLSLGPDGRWSALDAQGLYRAKHTAGAVFRTALQHELTTRLGVRWRPAGKGLTEIAGIPHEVITAFSKRRTEIEAEMAAAGVEGAEAAAAAMLATRTAKVDVDPHTLRDRWADEAAAIGFTGASIDALLGTRPAIADDTALTVRLPDAVTGELVDVEIRSDVFAGWVGARMAEIDSTCTRHQITEIVAAALRGGVSARSLEQLSAWVLAHPELVPIPAPRTPPQEQTGWEQRWTSRRLLHIETESLAAITDPHRHVPVSPLVVEHAINRVGSLGADQAAAVRTIAGNGRPVAVMVGRAGTGKTFTLAALRTVLEDGCGLRVIGVAPSARAARELADGAGIEAFTFPRFQLHAAHELTAHHVVVVDEAGMAGTVDLHGVLTRARDVGARVILVGDHHQLPEVQAGGVFAAAIGTLGGDVAELTVNRRQAAPWEHDALAQLRAGNPLAGFRAYQDHGHVTIASTTVEVRAAAVDAWHTAHQQGVDAIVLAGTRAEAAALNRLARRQVAGKLSGPILELHNRHFQAGDRVVLLRNGNGHVDGHLDLDRGTPARVDNGMVGTIQAIRADDALDIRLGNGRQLRIAGDYVRAGWVDHGYATTIHKAQGLTCDQVFLVGPAGLFREAAYVAMSRARYGAYVYATRADVAELVERAHSTGIPLEAEHADELDHDLRQAVEQSRAKVLALTHHRLLQPIAAVADQHHLDWLWDRHVRCRRVAADLVAAGLTDPTHALTRLELARAHRQFLSAGTRVNAADWDNVGTVLGVFDRTGTAYVRFTSADGKRTTTKTLEWADLRPVDHPEPAELTDDAHAYFALAQQCVDEHAADWHDALQGHGLHPDELVIIPAAIATRRQRLAHQLAGDPPGWLTWWYGPRPSDPAGAQVWDDEIGQLAAWRDARHHGSDIAGYGPRPDDSRLAARWEEHLDRSLTTRSWLHTHSPSVPAPGPQPLDIAAVRERLAELDAILATAPPDQRRIIDALHANDLDAADLHQALVEAGSVQHARRQWILEHWPHVVEHAELSKVSAAHPPLAHWPQPPTAAVLDRHHQLQAISSDTPEASTLVDLDQQVADASPLAANHRLDRQRAAIANRIAQLDAVAPHADHEQADILAHHRQRLLARLTQLDEEARRHNAQATLWHLGHRPSELADAITRRANHLAHDAITTGQPWVYSAVGQWHDTHPDGTTAELHQLITRIAAYRERAHHTGSDPIGPEPALELRSQWQVVHDGLHTRPAASITALLQR